MKKFALAALMLSLSVPVYAMNGSSDRNADPKLNEEIKKLFSQIEEIEKSTLPQEEYLGKLRAELSEKISKQDKRTQYFESLE